MALRVTPQKTAAIVHMIKAIKNKNKVPAHDPLPPPIE